MHGPNGGGGLAASPPQLPITEKNKELMRRGISIKSCTTSVKRFASSKRSDTLNILVGAYRDGMAQHGLRRADMRPPRAMKEVSTVAGCGEGTSLAARSAWGRPQKDMNTTAGRYTATGPRPREGMAEQIWKRLTSVIGLARIEWCQRQGGHESQENHRAATRRTPPARAVRQVWARFASSTKRESQAQKVGNLRDLEGP